LKKIWQNYRIIRAFLSWEKLLKTWT